MNSLQSFLIALAAVFVILLPLSRKFAWRYARFTVLLLVAAVMLTPFVWLACAAFKSTDAMSQYSFLPPPSQMSAKTLNLDNFRELLKPEPTTQGPVTFWRYVVNSLFLASATTAISLFFCSLGGYALAKYRFAGRNVIMIYMLASMTIPGVVLLAPNFEVIWRLGWMDTYKALIVPGAVGAFGIFLFRQAMLSIPTELIEAARIDGCNEFRIYLTLIMPLVRPMSGAFCLISFMGAWNAFLAPNIFLQSQNKLTLPVVLNQYMGTYVEHYGIFLAGTLLAMIPPAILFIALQREFISGLTSGAVKQ
jgi:arabinooligosaccharide transport system permease protein